MRALLVLMFMLAGVVIVCCSPIPQPDVAIAPVTPVVYSALPTYGYTTYSVLAAYNPYAYPFSYAYGYYYYV